MEETVKAISSMDLELWESLSEPERAAWVNSLTDRKLVDELREGMEDFMVPMLEFLLISATGKGNTDGILSSLDAVHSAIGLLTARLKVLDADADADTRETLPPDVE